MSTTVSVPVKIEATSIERQYPHCDSCKACLEDGDPEATVHFCQTCSNKDDSKLIMSLAKNCNIDRLPPTFLETMRQGSDVFVPLLQKGFEKVGPKLEETGITKETWERWCTNSTIFNAVMQIMIAYALTI